LLKTNFFGMSISQTSCLLERQLSYIRICAGRVQLSYMGTAINMSSTYPQCGKVTRFQYLWFMLQLLQLGLIWSTKIDTIEVQHVQNSLTQVALQAPKLSHDEPPLHSLHWLPVKQHVHCQLATRFVPHQCRTTGVSLYV